VFCPDDDDELPLQSYDCQPIRLLSRDHERGLYAGLIVCLKQATCHFLWFFDCSSTQYSVNSVTQTTNAQHWCALVLRVTELTLYCVELQSKSHRRWHVVCFRRTINPAYSPRSWSQRCVSRERFCTKFSCSRHSCEELAASRDGGATW